MGFCPQLGGVGPCPAQCIWQGSGFAADQTNAMLAVVRADDESLAVVRADDESLVPPQAAELALSVARPLPTETASLGFGGSPVGGGDKNSRVIFFTFLCGRGITYPLVALSVSEQPGAGFISAEKRFSQSGCSAPTNTLFPPAHSAFLAPLCVGWYHYPRRALHAVETLGAQGTRRRIRRFYAAAVFALCGLNVPSSGTHATPSPKRAHSGSHAETRRVLRVDGDDVSGSWIIDTIDPFQADQTVAVALTEGHRNAVPP